MENTEENNKTIENSTTNINNNSNLEDIEKKEPLFRIVLPKRRSWFYSFTYYIRGLKFVQAFLGPQTKALPAPSKFRS